MNFKGLKTTSLLPLPLEQNGFTKRVKTSYEMTVSSQVFRHLTTHLVKRSASSILADFSGNISTF